jgi:hypothetical protein
VLGLLHFETTSKACFRKLERDEEGNKPRSGLLKAFGLVQCGRKLAAG